MIAYKLKTTIFPSRTYGGPQLSHQIQILTSKTNSPHQKQIPHIKIKFTTSNTNSPQQKQNRHSKNNIRHIKNEIVTSKTNLSQQKQIPHIKSKSLTPKSKTQIKRSAVNERKLSPVFTRPSPDRHFVLAHGTVCGYVVLGPRIKNYNLEFLTSRAEIFPEDNFYGSRDHLKVASSKRKYFSCNSKKGDLARGSLVRECGPWSSNHTSSTNSPDNFRTMRILTIFYLFFIILDISKLPSCWKSF